MIVFDLQCGAGCNPFEAWFRSSADYEEQRAQALVECPFCRSSEVQKAPMAPQVPRKRAHASLERLAAVQAELLRSSRWVGDRFADEARAIHCGERPAEQVHGSATLEQAKSLLEEGVPVAPLPLPVTPPDQIN